MKLFKWGWGRDNKKGISKEIPLICLDVLDYAKTVFEKSIP